MKKLGDTKIYFTEVHNAFANASADQIQKDYVLPRILIAMVSIILFSKFYLVKLVKQN